MIHVHVLEVEEVEHRRQTGFLTMLFQRVANILRELQIEACEWSAIVLHAMWFIPLLQDGTYLTKSPFAKTAIEHIPNGNIVVFIVAGVMLTYHLATSFLGGPPSFLIQREEDQQFWYWLRIVGMLVSWLWFGWISLLFTGQQITGGTILFAAGSLSCYIGSHKLYLKMRASWNYVLLKMIQQKAEEMMQGVSR